MLAWLKGPAAAVCPWSVRACRESTEPSTRSRENFPGGHSSWWGGWNCSTHGLLNPSSPGCIAQQNGWGENARQLKNDLGWHPVYTLLRLLGRSWFPKSHINVNTEPFTYSSGASLEKKYIHHLVKGVWSVRVEIKEKNTHTHSYGKTGITHRDLNL